MGLIAHWPLDGNANDVIGNRNGVIGSGATWVDTGKIGNALNSTRVVNSNVLVPHDAEISKRIFGPESNNFSICFWYYPRTMASYGTVVQKAAAGNWSSSTTGFWAHSNDKLGFIIGNNTTGNTSTDYRIINTTLSLNEWHFCVGILHNNTMYFYVNNILVGTNDASLITGRSETTTPIILGGARTTGASDGLDGKVNDIRIYDHVLSLKEMHELGKAKILHYTFNDFQEPTTNEFDESIMVNTIYGGPGVVQNTLDAFGTTDNVVRRITEGKVRFGNHTGVDVGTLYYGNTYTFSIYLRSPNMVLDAGMEFDICDRTGTKNYSGSLESNITTYWKRFTMTVFLDNSASYHFIDIGTYLGTGVWEWCCAQIELKDYATPFTPNTRTGIVRDNSGFGHDAVLVEANTPRWVKSEKIGSGSYDFGITTDVSNYLQCDVFNNPTDQITINIWLHPIDVGDYSRGFASKANDASGTNGWVFRTGWGDDVRFNVGGNSGGQASVGVNNNLCMITGTYNSITGILNWYKNGVLANTMNLTPAAIGNSSNPLYVGYSSGTGYHKGTMEDFRIYATEFDVDDILELYQTRGQLDNTGNLFLNEFTTNGFKPTILDYTSWVIGSAGGQVGFSANGSTSENSIIVRDNPIGDIDVVWASLENDSTSNSDGGWDSSSYPIDNTKIYRHTCWIRRENAGSGDGTTYFGTHGYGSVNGLANVGGAGANTNPYFRTDGDGLTNDNEWMLWVGYIIPTGSSSEPTFITDTKGIWNTSEVRTSSSCTTFQFLPETTSSNFRAYLYYSTKLDERMYFYRPRVEIVDGNEPTINTLLRCSEHRPLINDNNEDVWDLKNISDNGTGNYVDISEVGITDGLVGYWKLNGDAKDYSGNENHGTVVGPTVTSGLKDLAYSFNGSSNYITCPPMILDPNTFTCSGWFQWDIIADGGTIFGVNYNNPSSGYLIRETSAGRIVVYSDHGSETSIQSIQVLSTATWYHLGVTQDNGVCSIYLNGVLDNSATLTNPVLSGTDNLEFGRRTSPVGAYMDGKITDARIYNRVLTPEEINIQYKFGLPNTGMQLSTNGTLYLNNETNEAL